MEDFIMDSYDEYLLQCGIISLEDFEKIMSRLEQEELEERWTELLQS